jgi:ferredoxin-NADP reductase
MLSETLKALADNPALTLGWALLGGLMLQVGFLVAGGARRLWFENRRSRLEQERLALEIKAAMLKIQTVEQARVAWNGIRKFTVVQKVPECADTFSFHLKPHDGKPLPAFRPGQYLTFQVTPPGSAKPIIRCYSLSDSARPTHYRVTIKRCPPPTDSEHPPGVISSYFCDTVKVGDILDVKAPSGHFFLDMEKGRPVVLISGGVGVTPMIAMANALVEAGSTREIWFFFGARNSREHMFKDAVAALAAKYNNIRLHICYSKPLPTDVLGRDYQHEGRVTVELFKELLPSNNYDYFLCGPGAFMESITDDLRTWGVPDSWVHFEAFGPASVKRAAKPEIKAALTRAPMGGVDVTFAKSGKKASWNGDHGSLLELAEEQGIRIDAGCRAGNCGSCLIAIKAGEVEYLGNHGADAEAGSCLACICKPKGRLVVDA